MILTNALRAYLVEAKKLLDSLKGGSKVVKTGDFGDLLNDAELKADVVMGEFLQRKFAESELPVVKITVEGLEDRLLSSLSGHLWVCIDQLDGSLDYAMKGNTLGLPYSACVTILDRASDAIFDNIIAAGVIDLRSGDVWGVARTIENRFSTFVNDEPAKTMQAKELDLGKMIVLGEMYYPENRERLARAFAGKKGWLRNPGSAAYEMALVSSGQAVAYICDRQKQHELGAAYALVKGAGGVAVDFEGKDLGPRVYDFKTQTPVILAANMQIARQIIRLLRA